MLARRRAKAARACAGDHMSTSAENTRLEEAREGKLPWKKWGPYLSERQWGTVREDYSETGDAWNYFSHDQARSRAYRWGEDGLAGISDDEQRLCFALALWNGSDPILKERLFGLTNSEGNHGEDVKEYYFYLDSTPTHSYLKYLYKYPQRAYPYDLIVATNRARPRTEPEFELIDTGIFDDNRYFDVFVEYAKASPEDILVEITVCNRGPAPAQIQLLPTLWFRNTWSMDPSGERPTIRLAGTDQRGTLLIASHSALGRRTLHAEGNATALVTENETNNERLFRSPNHSRFVKDGINDFIVLGRKEAINAEQRGTKAALHYALEVPALGTSRVRLRLGELAGPTAVDAPSVDTDPFGDTFDAVFDARRREADEFYQSIVPPSLDADSRNVMRQALAGMLWSKQFYYYDVSRWLKEHGVNGQRKIAGGPRNQQWHHMHNADVISMPDKWEYPWYAAWDLAFHVVAFTLVDRDFAKQQLDLMLRTSYLHPNGQLPAYEWNFGDVNPPVHAWSTIFTYYLEKSVGGKGDVEWLERSFHKLMLNFTWWVNRKDLSEDNIFEGGFLGLDNIGVFDRSSPLPTGGHLQQADGTAWMALYSQNMLEIAIELTRHKPSYSEMCVKFAEHFLLIASSMIRTDQRAGIWDEEDGFFYDVLQLPDGAAQCLKVRSMVGILPMCAVNVYDGEFADAHPELTASMKRVLQAWPELIAEIHDPVEIGVAGRRMTAVLNADRLRRVLRRVLDESEFLSPHGIRSMSRVHADQPFVFHVGQSEHRVAYLPGESDSGMFGGNSNWRGPIWMPVNGLIVRALLLYYTYYGDEFTVECPTGSGRQLNLYQVAEEITRRLSGIFLRGPDGRRPVYGGTARFQDDPHWRDLLQYFEYFHGDNGAGIGASHQTGWTGIVAALMQLFGSTTAEDFLTKGKRAALNRRTTAKQAAARA
jgi:hypothetical protein